jgi:hypothetical protein
METETNSDGDDGGTHVSGAAHKLGQGKIINF